MSIWDRLVRLLSKSSKMRSEIDVLREELDTFQSELKAMQREAAGNAAYERRQRRQA